MRSYAKNLDTCYPNRIDRLPHFIQLWKKRNIRILLEQAQNLNSYLEFCNYNYYYLFRKRFEFNYRYTKPYIRYVNACICTHSIFPFSYQVNYMNIYTLRLAIQDFLIKVECIIIFCPLFGNVNVLTIYYIQQYLFAIDFELHQEHHQENTKIIKFFVVRVMEIQIDSAAQEAPTIYLFLLQIRKIMPLSSTFMASHTQGSKYI